MPRLKNLKTSNSSTVLGVDPGFDRIGLAIVEGDKLLFSDCVTTDRKSPHEDRLQEIGESVRNVIKEWRPESLAIEKLFFNQNVSTAMKVSEARGVIIYEAAGAGLEVFEYSPQAIKIAVTSYGKASKEQVAEMTKKLVKIKENSSKKLDDEIDAIALCITHLATKKGI